MSTKVYNAYRVKRGHNIFDVCEDIKRRGIENARQALREHYEKIRENPTFVFKMWLIDNKKDSKPYLRRYGWAAEFIEREYAKSESTKVYDNSFVWEYAMNCSLMVHENRGRYYIRALTNGMMSGILDFLRDHEALEDFHYQNSTDRPESITAREWAYREKVWGEIFPTVPPYMRMMTVEIVTFDTFFRICPARQMDSDRADKLREEGKLPPLKDERR